MRLFNFLAQNGFIVSSSELRRMTELDAVSVNDNKVSLKELNTTQVKPGDIVRVGKNQVVVYRGP